MESLGEIVEWGVEYDERGRGGRREGVGIVSGGSVSCMGESRGTLSEVVVEVGEGGWDSDGRGC